MKDNKSNLVLIGMPGSGKSTVGVILAKRMARDFVDTDVLIQTAEHRTLQDIVDTQGYRGLRQVEERLLLQLRAHDTVISTGGSAVYSDAAMRHLRQDAAVVYLDVSLETLMQRITNAATRGIARRPGQSFEELFQERAGLYRRYADITIPCDSLSQEAVCEEITAALDTP